MPKCFWFEQGRCGLDYFEPRLVFDILARNPTARQALLSCASGTITGCTDIEQDYIDFAMRDDTLVQDLIEANEQFMDFVRRYTDRTAEANRAQPATPVVPPSED